MFLSKNVCPVPFDQQPLNEYNSLKQSCFFSWFSLKTQQYIQMLLIATIFMFIGFIPLILATNAHLFLSVKFCTLDLMLVNFVMLLVLIRLYLAWLYITNRLLSATVFYEESGWYDGKIWVKTAEVLIRDRYIGTYKLFPLLQRLQYTLNILFLFFVFECLAYYLI